MSPPQNTTVMQWRRAMVAEPHRLAWATAWSFMVGSSLFALGSLPPYSQNVDPGLVGITFVAGSVFFTAAGYGQFVQVVRDPSRPRRGRGLFAWRPTERAWLAVAVQLVGTILFNINTIDAMIEGLTTEQTNRLVWAPDMFGSAAFLIASHLAWIGCCGRLWCVRTGEADWWSSLSNYVGSIFFGLSAIASFALRTTGDTLNTTIVNSGTFAGAICFLAGAYLLLPPANRTRAGDLVIGDAAMSTRPSRRARSTEVTVRQRIRYRFDNMLARGTGRGPRLARSGHTRRRPAELAASHHLRRDVHRNRGLRMARGVLAEPAPDPRHRHHGR